MVKKYKKQRRRVEAKTAAQERIRSKRESNQYLEKSKECSIK